MLVAARILEHESNIAEKIAEHMKVIADYEQQLKKKKRKIKSTENTSVAGTLTLGIIFLAIGLFSLFICVVSFVLLSMVGSREAPEAIAVGVIGAPAIVLGICFIARTFPLKKSLKKDHEKAKKDYDKALAQINPKIEEERKGIEKIEKECTELAPYKAKALEFLPEAYWNLDAVAFMLMAIKNGRADTLKEVINLYEQELRHWEMMGAMQMNAEITTAALSEIESNQQIINENINRRFDTMTALQIADILLN